jgi:hypothetical protein
MIILYAIIAILLCVNAYLVRELRHYKKRDDYYVSVDEENARLKRSK